MNIIETNLSFGSMSNRRSTKRIILHHADASHCTAEDIHRWHKRRGWVGAGYHFLVRKDGSIYRLRPENKVGSHALNNNSDSIGICFEGAYMTETMPDAQKQAGKELVAYLKNKYGISNVHRHKDVGSTDCPGKNFPFVEIAGVPAGSVSDSSGSSASSGSGNMPGTFLVKVLVPDLTIRAGAGTKYKAVGHIKDKGTYTIIEVKYNGSTPWGRLKSGTGWISLVSKYTKRV